VKRFRKNYDTIKIKEDFMISTNYASLKNINRYIPQLYKNQTEPKPAIKLAQQTNNPALDRAKAIVMNFFLYVSRTQGNFSVELEYIKAEDRDDYYIRVTGQEEILQKLIRVLNEKKIDHFFHFKETAQKPGYLLIVVSDLQPYFSPVNSL
jgi:hypothetical protein